MAMFRKTEDEAAPAVADLLETVDDDVKVCVCVCVSVCCSSTGFNIGLQTYIYSEKTTDENLTFESAILQAALYSTETASLPKKIMQARHAMSSSAFIICIRTGHDLEPRGPCPHGA